MARREYRPVRSRYAVVYEDPADMDAPCAITRPDPNWMASALAGGVLPPVGAYHAATHRVTVQFPGEAPITALVRGDKIADARAACLRQGGKVLSEIIVDHPAGYADPVAPMTEVEAIEYMIQRAVPPRVWRDYRGNRRVLRVVNAEKAAADRRMRDHWKIKQEASKCRDGSW